MPEREQEYLGDGVYATFDGYFIWLKTDRYDTGASVTHRIALEPSVFAGLVEYEARVWAKKKKQEQP